MRVRWAWRTARVTDGIRIAISTRMMPITAISSTSVKPVRPRRAVGTANSGENEVIFRPVDSVGARADQDIRVLPAGDAKDARVAQVGRPTRGDLRRAADRPRREVSLQLGAEVIGLRLVWQDPIDIVLLV